MTRAWALWLWGWSLWWPVSALGADHVEEVRACLDLQDVACAEALVDESGMANASDPRLRGLAARVAFHAGDYPTAVDRMAQAVASGLDDRHDELRLFRNTLHATAGWVERRFGRFRVRYQPGVDALLAEDAADVLRATDANVVPMLGEVPPGSTLVELFPDGERFLASSSLTRADVESPGVVAMSKWSRLLVISPRVMGGGYDWKDTTSHEYLHLVVAHNSRDRAPVWLQEGIAKALDHRWRGESLQLSPKAETQLARAIATDTLVPFPEMHPSLAKIKVFKEDGRIDRHASAARAQLAYAQLATLIAFVMEDRGDDVVRRVLVRVGEGEDSFGALAAEAGRSSFDVLIDDWRGWLEARQLEDRGVESRAMTMDGGSEAEADPVMGRRRDLWNRLRLGDLLMERERYRAALVEYEQAADTEDPNSPARAVRMAAAWIGLDDDPKARRLLEASLSDYPTYPESYRLLAQLDRAQGRERAAAENLEQALAYAPFGLEDLRALRELHASLGQREAVAKVDRRLSILRFGGEVDPPPPIHDIEGPLDVPEGQGEADAASSEGRRGIEGRAAPGFRLQGLDGQVYSLDALRGRVVVVDFWATWCGPCRAVMPALSQLAARHDPQALTVLGLSDETEGIVRRFVRAEENDGRTYAYPFLLDDGSVRDAYRVRSIPTLVVVDPKGRVHAVHVGAGDMAAIVAEVEALVERSAGAPKDPTQDSRRR